MPEVTILYFAGLRDSLGITEERMELPERVNQAEVLSRIGLRHPQLLRALTACRVACDEEFVADEVTVRTGSAVALIPPVSGG